MSKKKKIIKKKVKTTKKVKTAPIKVKKTKTAKVVKKPTRIKFCPKCNAEVGRKVRTCGCGHKFEFKKIGKYEEIKDWKTLKEGHIIYLRKGSRGPYYLSPEKGKILMGYRGKFTVKNVVEKGIEAYGGIGFAFLYMGPNEYSESTGIYKRSYRLFKKT